MQGLRQGLNRDFFLNWLWFPHWPSKKIMEYKELFREIMTAYVIMNTLPIEHQLLCKNISLGPHTKYGTWHGKESFILNYLYIGITFILELSWSWNCLCLGIFCISWLPLYLGYLYFRIAIILISFMKLELLLYWDYFFNRIVFMLGFPLHFWFSVGPGNCLKNTLMVLY